MVLDYINQILSLTINTLVYLFVCKFIFNLICVKAQFYFRNLFLKFVLIQFLYFLTTLFSFSHIFRILIMYFNLPPFYRIKKVNKVLSINNEKLWIDM